MILKNLDCFQKKYKVALLNKDLQLPPLVGIILVHLVWCGVGANIALYGQIPHKWK